MPSQGMGHAIQGNRFAVDGSNTGLSRSGAQALLPHHCRVSVDLHVMQSQHAFSLADQRFSSHPLMHPSLHRLAWRRAKVHPGLTMPQGYNRPFVCYKTHMGSFLIFSVPFDSDGFKLKVSDFLSPWFTFPTVSFLTDFYTSNKL